LKTGTDHVFRQGHGKRGLSLILFLSIALLAGCGTLASAPQPGEAAFGVLGDVPYSEGEAERLERVIDEMNAEDLAFVVHVGDIGTSAQACRDDWVEARKRQFARIRHPFVLLPGDNEWSDCHALGLDPRERLESWRRQFCSPTLRIERQAGPYCEHMRWERGGWLFVALNVPGNNNNFRQPREHAERMAAAFAWLDESAKRAAREQKTLVVLMQANPFIVRPRADGYAELRARLQALAGRMPARVFLVHGDTHIYRNDEPLPGLRRIEVWGSPIVSWTRIAISEPPR
jgi:hypothetical protein